MILETASNIGGAVWGAAKGAFWLASGLAKGTAGFAKWAVTPSLPSTTMAGKAMGSMSRGLTYGVGSVFKSRKGRLMGPALLGGGMWLAAKGVGALNTHTGYGMDPEKMTWNQSRGRQFGNPNMEFSGYRRSYVDQNATGALALALHNRRKG